MNLQVELHAAPLEIRLHFFDTLHVEYSLFSEKEWKKYA